MKKGKMQPRIISTLFSLIFAITTLLTVFFVLSHFSKKESVIQKSNVDLSDRSSIEGLIKEFGGKDAYTDIKKFSKDMDIFEKHGLGHRFGEILYRVEGTKGIQVCDSELSYGCFHSFTIAAIFDKGLGIVNEIDKNCIEKYGVLGHGCTHGIGHGLIEYFGATEEGLAEGLEICQGLTYKGRVMGCKNGLFMEFNHPSPTGSGELRPSRVIDENDPHYPCNVIKKEFEPACYYEQGKWIHRMNQSLNAGLDYCNSIQDERNRQVCLIGVGANAAESALFDSKKAFELCSYLEEQNGRTFCAAGAEFMIRATNPGIDTNKTPCSMLALSVEECRKNAETIVD